MLEEGDRFAIDKTTNKLYILAGDNLFTSMMPASFLNLEDELVVSSAGQLSTHQRYMPADLEWQVYEGRK